MILQIAPQFFTTGLAATLTYYKDKLGFDCLGTWDDPPVYAIVERDGRLPLYFGAVAGSANAVMLSSAVGASRNPPPVEVMTTY